MGADKVNATQDTKSQVDRGTEKNPLVVKPEPFERPEVRVEWQGPTRLFEERQPVWFVGLFSLAIIVVILLALVHQWTLTLAIVSFIFALFAMNIVEPGRQRYAVSTYGIKIGKKTIKYDKLKWFWFAKEDHKNVLYISTYLNLPHIFEMPLPDGDVSKLKGQIEDELLKHLPYHEEGEHDWLDTLDNIIARIEPWLPASLIQWYSRRFHNAQ